MCWIGFVSRNLEVRGVGVIGLMRCVALVIHIELTSVCGWKCLTAFSDVRSDIMCTIHFYVN
jgi:hypothetical protein